MESLCHADALRRAEHPPRHGFAIDRVMRRFQRPHRRHRCIGVYGDVNPRIEGRAGRVHPLRPVRPEGKRIVLIPEIPYMVGEYVRADT